MTQTNHNNRKHHNVWNYTVSINVYMSSLVQLWLTKFAHADGAVVFSCWWSRLESFGIVRNMTVFWNVLLTLGAFGGNTVIMLLFGFVHGNCGSTQTLFLWWELRHVHSVKTHATWCGLLWWCRQGSNNVITTVVQSKTFADNCLYECIQSSLCLHVWLTTLHWFDVV